MNKHGVSIRWFTEADVKQFTSGALRTITNITRSMVNWKKMISSQVNFKDFGYRYKSFLKCKCFWLLQDFSRILLIDSELPTLKIDFFEVIFQKFC